MWTRAAATAALGGVLFLAAALPAAAGESLEAIEKALAEKWTDITSVSAKVKINANMMGSTSEGTSMKSDGTLEVMVQDGKSLMRMESTMEHSMGGQTMKMSSLMISDGEYTYALNDAMGQKMATKSKTNSADKSLFGSGMIAALKEHNEVSAGDDAKVDGKDCYVLVAKSKSGSTDSPTLKYYFDKSNGLVLKVEGVGPKGETQMTVVYSDVKVNPKLDPQRFKFVAPEGVQVMEIPGQ